MPVSNRGADCEVRGQRGECLQAACRGGKWGRTQEHNDMSGEGNLKQVKVLKYFLYLESK